MRLIDADKAQTGLTVVAEEQTEGKGQRGRKWTGGTQESLMMSIVATPDRALREIFVYSASIAVAIAGYLAEKCPESRVRIKWPNDIIINDKKAGGILLENVIRGAKWSYGVVGLGLNIRQEFFPRELCNATSLKIESGIDFSINEIKNQLRATILQSLYTPVPAADIITEYNRLLYRRGKKQIFSDGKKFWEVRILGALTDGSLQVEKDKQILQYMHGAQEWVW